MIRGLVDFALNNRILVIAFAILLFIWGAISFKQLPVEAYPDGVVVPLSTFNPKNIPDPQGKQIVFACRSGKRSVTASMAAQAAGLPYDKHLAGGMLGWKQAGLPTRTGG